MNIANYISFKETFRNYDSDNSKRCLDIVYCANNDYSYLLAIGVSMHSVIHHNKNLNLHFHLFLENCNSEFIEQYKKMLTKDVVISLYEINNSAVKEFFGNDFSFRNGTYAAYYRLFAIDFLKTKIASFLYLDADAFCNNSLEFFLTIETECPIAGVIDFDHAKHQLRLATLSARMNYINSGVIFVKCSNITRGVLDGVNRMISNENIRPLIEFHDQDLINMVYFDNILVLDDKFNCMVYARRHKLFDISKATIVHYIAAYKPWFNVATKQRKKYDLFLQMKDASVFKDFALQEPHSKREAMLFYKFAYTWLNFRESFKYFKLFLFL